MKSYETTESRLQLALDAVVEGMYPNCAKAAAAFEVSARTLQRRWKGTAFKSTRPFINKALTDAQEQAIFDYIDDLNNINMSARSKMITAAANYLIRPRRVEHQ